MSVSSDSPLPALGSVLLSAGRGMRIRPLSDACPKAALPLLDVPQARPALLSLRASAPPVLVNLGHLAAEGSRRLGLPGLPDVEVLEEVPEPYGTGGTLSAVAPRLAPTVVTYNADTLTDLRLEDLLATHRRLGASATLAVTRLETGADFVVEQDLLVRLVDRRREEAGAGARFIGVGVFDREALALLPETKPLGLAEGLLARLAAERRLALHDHSGYARDVGSIADYLQASFDLLHERALVDNFAPPGRVVDVDGGLAYIGPGAQVEARSLGPDAIVLEGGRVERRARVERAIVWPGELVPPGAEPRDGVWFEGDLLAAGGAEPRSAE